ncbi:glycoside hydrolase, partial [Achlya hypogyna]
MAASVSAGLCNAVQPHSYSVASSTNAAFIPAINELKKHPVGSWYSDRANGDQIDQLMSQCGGDVPVIVIYGLPSKDCGAGGYSNGGTNQNAEQYAAWIQSLVDRVGNKEVIYVVEPDAVGLISGNSCAKEHKYEDNLKVAIQKISTNANAHIYVDVAAWSTQSTAVNVLKTLQGSGRVNGIAINTSNYHSTAEMVAMCQSYSSATGGMHCVIDTSRNANGSPQNEWCNAKSAGIGAPPTSSTGNNIVDYYLWLKVPGESDGECTDKDRSSDAAVGPSAGLFFPNGFKSLWDQSSFVKNGAAVIGGSPNPQPSPAPSTQAPQPSPA